MITEEQQELGIRCALGELGPEEQERFTQDLRTNPELREFLYSVQTSLGSVARALPQIAPSAGLKQKILGKLNERTTSLANVLAGLRFVESSDSGWKPLPVPGAYIKLLSLQRDRGYAVLLGKLDPGARYPAHRNVGAEDFYILTGDLHIGSHRLGAGDFHHADAGSEHQENYSIEGCTLIAVLTTDDPLVSLAAGS